MSPLRSPVSCSRSCAEPLPGSSVKWKGVWEAGGQQVEAGGGPQTSPVPSLRLNCSVRQEVAEIGVTTACGREQLWGKMSMWVRGQSVRLS